MAKSAISSKTLPAIPVQPSAADQSRAAAKPSADYVMDAPLAQLIEELGITYKDAPITDPGFTGYAWVDSRGVILAMPADRSEVEHDCMARYLIGRAFDVEGMPELPEPFEVTDVTAPTEQLRQACGGASDAAP